MTPESTIVAIPSLPPARIDALLRHRWGRLVVPSLLDLLFIALIGWLFMSSGPHGWQSLLADADVGWHIRTGEYILDHHQVPHHDLYSFSKPGAPWFAWEWLSDVIDALLFRWAGLKGVVLAAGVMIALYATTLMRRIVDAGAHLFVALLVTLLSVGSASMHFLARPHVFTLLLLSISMALIEADRRGANPSRIWWLVPITLVWTNLHGGFLVLIGLLGLAAIGAAVEAWIQRPRRCAPGLGARIALGHVDRLLRRRVLDQSLRLGIAPPTSFNICVRIGFAKWCRNSSPPFSAMRTCCSSKPCCLSG